MQNIFRNVPSSETCKNMYHVPYIL